MANDKEQIVESNKLATEYDGVTRLTVLFVIISLVVSMTAIIVASTSLGTTINVNKPSVSNENYQDDVWLFGFSHEFGVGSYIDNVTGTLRGYLVEIVDAVCLQANKKCRSVIDDIRNCWDSEAGQRSRPGKGLMNRWYDACTGWYNTYERALAFQFSSDLRKGVSTAFYVKKGNPHKFDPTSIRPNQTIGFGDGWSADEYCLAKNGDTISGVPLLPSQIVHYTTADQFIEAVNNDEIIAVFTYEGKVGERLQQIGRLFTNCNRGGAAIMSRKDSTLNEWWNPAFQQIKQNGVYKDICDRIATDHGGPHAGGDVICLD